MKKLILIVIAVVILGGGAYALKNITEKTENVDQSSVQQNQPPDSASSSSKVVKQGKFIDADDVHKGTGTAQVVKNGQENFVKFSDDFSVTNGPDLFIYFSKTADANNKDPGDFVSLGKIKKTSGEQTYKLPDNIDGYKSVVVWCRAFKQPFALAPLQ